MRKFDTIQEAFEWWIVNIYPSMPPDLKKGKPVTAWRDYKYNQGISEKRMRDILIEFGHFRIETSIIYEP